MKNEPLVKWFLIGSDSPRPGVHCKRIEDNKQHHQTGKETDKVARGYCVDAARLPRLLSKAANKLVLALCQIIRLERLMPTLADTGEHAAWQRSWNSKNFGDGVFAGELNR